MLTAIGTNGDWVGWFDGAHVITGFYQRRDSTSAVVDLSTGSAQKVAAHGIVAAMLSRRPRLLAERASREYETAPAYSWP